MFYNKAINKYLKEMYRDILENASILENFFDHISSCSISLQSLLNVHAQ